MPPVVNTYGVKKKGRARLPKYIRSDDGVASDVFDALNIKNIKKKKASAPEIMKRKPKIATRLVQPFDGDSAFDRLLEEQPVTKGLPSNFNPGSTFDYLLQGQPVAESSGRCDPYQSPVSSGTERDPVNDSHWDFFADAVQRKGKQIRLRIHSDESLTRFAPKAVAKPADKPRYSAGNLTDMRDSLFSDSKFKIGENVTLSESQQECREELGLTSCVLAENESRITEVLATSTPVRPMAGAVSINSVLELSGLGDGSAPHFDTRRLSLPTAEDQSCIKDMFASREDSLAARLPSVRPCRSSLPTAEDQSSIKDMFASCEDSLAAHLPSVRPCRDCGGYVEACHCLELSCKERCRLKERRCRKTLPPPIKNEEDFYTCDQRSDVLHQNFCDDSTLEKRTEGLFQNGDNCVGECGNLQQNCYVKLHRIDDESNEPLLLRSQHEEDVGELCKQLEHGIGLEKSAVSLAMIDPSQRDQNLSRRDQNFCDDSTVEKRTEGLFQNRGNCVAECGSLGQNCYVKLNRIDDESNELLPLRSRHEKDVDELCKQLEYGIGLEKLAVFSNHGNSSKVSSISQRLSVTQELLGELESSWDNLTKPCFLKADQGDESKALENVKQDKTNESMKPEVDESVIVLEESALLVKSEQIPDSGSASCRQDRKSYGLGACHTLTKAVDPVVLKPGKKWRRSLSALSKIRRSSQGFTGVMQDVTEQDEMQTSDLSYVEYFHDPTMEVLRRCGQDKPLPFLENYPSSMKGKCKKIGEGVYGEVFMYEGSRNRRASVIKIIPIEGDLEVNGEPQKKFQEILSEVCIAQELSNLRNGGNNKTTMFNEVQAIRCVCGSYPTWMTELWHDYDADKGSENDAPDIFDDNQLFIVLELSNGGKDLESFVFSSADQSLAAFKQIALTLAVGESAIEFEHRDLHWGNVLLLPTKEKEVNFILDGDTFRVPCKGVQVSIIDFTLSRIKDSSTGLPVFFDLSRDETLFSAEGDYQFEVYRLMKQHTENVWSNFTPKTNVIWLHYLLDKLCSMARYRNCGSKVHQSALDVLQEMRDTVLVFPTVVAFAKSCYFNK